MSIPSSYGPAAEAERPALDVYLRAVADALADLEATPDDVLRAAQARGVRRNEDFARFLGPDPRLTDAVMKLSGVANGGSVPGSVRFRCAAKGEPVSLGEVARAFGAWRLGIPGNDGADTWPADFTVPYHPAARGAVGGATIFVSASLSGNPAKIDTRVLTILLRRDADDRK